MIKKDGETKVQKFLKKLKNAAEFQTDEFEILKSQFLSTTKKTDDVQSPKKVCENFYEDDFDENFQVPPSIEEENANETNIQKKSLSTSVVDKVVESTLSTTEVQNGLIKGQVVIGDTSVSIDPSITSSSYQTPTPDSESVIETVKQSIAYVSFITYIV
uniref:Uncharacterized protein n=1 Tax=Panagrolaimus davidi TaxID=227884 RepID=A0A914P4E6_9BILA